MKKEEYLQIGGGAKRELTLGYLHLRNRLPAVHSHKPGIALFSTAQIQDQP